MPDRTELETTPPRHPHDKGYRQLLNNKRTFLELLHTFVPEGWVQKIKEDDLTLVNKTYVQQDFSDKEADIVYRMRLGGTEVIFYVLLELQSTVDHTMPFRLLQYMVEIWRDVYKNTPEKERKRKSFRLPPVIPAVLYNGKRGWTACRSFRDYQSGQEHFPCNLLDFTYILFDVVRYSEEDLHRAANVISSVFYLDQTFSPGELVERLKKLAGVMKEMDPEQFRQVIIWLRNVIKRKLPEPLQNEIDRVLDETALPEVEKMITNIERALDEMRKQALLQGKMEGKAEGKAEGKVETAKVALMEGLDVEMVSKITGLAPETVLELKKKLEN